MSAACPEFSIRDNVGYEGNLVIARYGGAQDSRGLAEAHLEYLRTLHANGRLAQSHCRHGHACDRDRIHDMRQWAKAPTREVVLCKEHLAELASIREVA